MDRFLGNPAILEEIRPRAPRSGRVPSPDQSSTAMSHSPLPTIATIGPGPLMVTSANDLLIAQCGSQVLVCLSDAFNRVYGVGQLLDSCSGRFAGDRSIPAIDALERLIDAMTRQGGQREWMTAGLFGGAQLTSAEGSRFDIDAVLDLMKVAGIAVLHRDLGGSTARRVSWRVPLGQPEVESIEHCDGTHFELHEQSPGIQPDGMPKLAPCENIDQG